MSPDEPVIVPRRRILAFLERHPGAHLREIERGAKLAVGALRHHLDYLLEARLVTETRDGRLRRFYPAGVEPELRGILAVLRVRSHRAIAIHLLNHPGASAREISDAQRIPVRTVNHHLRTLVAADAVAREGDGYRLVDARRLLRALVAYKPSLADRMVDAALELWFENEA